VDLARIGEGRHGRGINDGAGGQEFRIGVHWYSWSL
jgi:hypothetical protein